MEAEIIPIKLGSEYRALPKAAREVAKRELTKLLKAELETEMIMRSWAESFFVTREEVGL